MFSDLWFKVRKDKCETPKGVIVDPYYVYEFPTWVAAVPVTDDGRIIMVRQYRHALGQVCLEIPGGCVDEADADVKAGIVRELSEETGYAFNAYHYLGKVSANPSTNNNWLHMFLATGGKQVSAQKLDRNEDIEVELYTIDELKQMLKDNKIVQAMHVSCLLYALNKLGELKY